MTLATAFPDDLAACHAMLAEMGAALTEKDAALASHGSVIEQLEHRVEEQKRELAKVSAERDVAFQLAFRKRQERYLDNPNQFRLDFGDIDDTKSFADGIANAADEQEDESNSQVRRKKRPRKIRNEQLPEHLPRYEVLLDVPEDKKICSIHGERTVIGYDWQETLEVVRPRLIVRRTGIPKLACPGEPSCGIVEAERPVGLVEGNRYDTSLAAEVITSKYGYHLPVYRQQDIFGSSGWTPARSTLLNVLKAAAQLVRPLVDSFHDLVRAGPVIGTDDTTVTLVVSNAPLPPNDCEKNERELEVIAKAREQQRGSITARMWAYRSVTIPINIFDFTVSRHRDGPAHFLKGFTGTLMADCYAGYEAIHSQTGGSSLARHALPMPGGRCSSQSTIILSMPAGCLPGSSSSTTSRIAGKTSRQLIGSGFAKPSRGRYGSRSPTTLTGRLWPTCCPTSSSARRWAISAITTTSSWCISTMAWYRLITTTPSS